MVYVHATCMGSGEVALTCFDPNCNHQNEGCVEGRAGPCECRKKGAPPMISLGSEAGRATILANAPLAPVTK